MTARITELPDGPADESGLTPRQRAILAVIRDTVETRGYPPSVREIGEGVGPDLPQQRRPPAGHPRADGLPAP